jgi:hypothetical protein
VSLAQRSYAEKPWQLRFNILPCIAAIIGCENCPSAPVGKGLDRSTDNAAIELGFEMNIIKRCIGTMMLDRPILAAIDRQ